MDKRLRKYYYAAVANLFLWLPLLSFAVFPRPETEPLYHDFRLAVIICGVVLAALLQHWTYYDIYRADTRLASSPQPRPEA